MASAEDVGKKLLREVEEVGLDEVSAFEISIALQYITIHMLTAN